MKHLIVACHPLESSVTMKIARAYAQSLEQLGHECALEDLYRRPFDPVMRADELEPFKRGTPDEVQRAQMALISADVLTVVYPLWWATMPAMMKGYIDRVFARGFAYEAAGGRNRGLLPGKRCVLMTLSGAPLTLLHQSGEWHAIKALQDAHIFKACGYQLLEHLHFEAVEPPTTDSALSAHLARACDCAERHFGRSCR
jgi:NAD(P)H dehydrogenase (quinone)